MKKIKILLVDDQLLFVESLRIVLESRTDVIQVVGIADNGVEAVEMAKRTRPDIILMDVRMPGTDGVEATRIIHSAMPKTKIVMLTTFDNDEYVMTLTVDVEGDYLYGYRFTDDDGYNFMYCDFDPGTADGFDPADLGQLTVN